MEKIFFMGAPSEVSYDDSIDTKTLLDRFGKNTGNLLIGYSLLKQLMYKEVSRDVRLNPKQINEEFDGFVIAASNFLRQEPSAEPYLDFMSKIIEQTNLPCVVVGVGSQAKDCDYNQDFKISEKTLRFFKLISDRSVSIGVRGQYTAEILGKYGVKNVEILGCPSFYVSCSPTIKVHKKPFNQVKKIVVNGSRNVTHQSFNPSKMRSIEKLLLKEALRYDSTFVAQNEYEEIVLSRGKKEEINDSIWNPIISYYQLSDDVEREKFIDFFNHKVKVFFDMKTWESQIRNYDFICGTRFHGSMIGIQNGVPATVIIHDSRTKEMCELLKIPHVLIDYFSDTNFDLSKIYDLADFDVMSANYSSLYSQYVMFLNNNGLKHKLSQP